MEYLVTFHWGWLAASAVFGLAMGWVAVVQRTTGMSRRGVYLSAAALAVAIVVSAARLIPGRGGYWLDLALAMLAAYLVGCALGSWLRARMIRRSAPPA